MFDSDGKWRWSDKFERRRNGQLWSKKPRIQAGRDNSARTENKVTSPARAEPTGTHVEIAHSRAPTVHPGGKTRQTSNPTIH